jgi:hypothetical protein
MKGMLLLVSYILKMRALSSSPVASTIDFLSIYIIQIIKNSQATHPIKQ